ncbi:endo-1,4-beta-xylanase 1-like, partial [Actinia tenebrosa]|uniref:Endo-1,4-beta-xylanase 1-like n=1 Tax=Actinia tenebrosa TaxID=6105 RepID=A0A6P8HMS5_ACTTE
MRDTCYAGILWMVVTCSVITCYKDHVFQEYRSLGCWSEDLLSTDRAIPDLLNDQYQQLSQSPTRIKDIVSECAQRAKVYGYSYFGVRDHHHCVSDPHAGLTYSKYGPSSLCRNGTGGPGAIDVYSFEGSIETEEELPTDDQTLPSQDRSKIQLRPQPVSAQGAATRDSLLPGARTSSLFLNGSVKPVSIEPLFEEIDEMKYGDFIPVPIGNNLLNNPSFELPLNPSPLDGWSCQGETDDPRGGALSRYSKDHHGNGRYSGICYARLSEWAGPGQYIGRKVKPLSVYTFTGWTQLLDRKNINDIHNMELWLRFKKRGQKNEIIMRLARRYKLSEDHGWVRWKTSFQMPASPRGFRYVFIFFRGPHRSVDIIADDMKLVEVMNIPRWKDKTDKLIETYRKRSVKLRINVPYELAATQDLSLMGIKVQQTKHRFGFGAAVNTESLIGNPKYRDFFFKHFEWAVMESSMKWPQVEKKMNHVDYQQVDKALEILEKHNVTIRGHCIFW